MLYNIKDYGAVGNGDVLETSAIQAAVDECTKNGGGTVLVPSGNYKIGKIILKDNVTLEVSAGARLFASPNREDYKDTPGFSGSLYNQGYDLNEGTRIRNDLEDIRKFRVAMIYACEAKNIAVTGRGIIDGQHENFLISDNNAHHAGKRWHNVSYNDGIRWSTRSEKFKFRHFPVFFEACTDVVLDGIKLINSPAYTVQMRSCEQVRITNIVIRNYVGAENSDGMHFSSCTDVRISNCDFQCGDDTIAIDSNDMKPSARFLIENCILFSRFNCFRIFTNLADSPVKRKLVKGGKVSDIVINNIVVKNASSLIYINTDDGEIERVTLTNASGVIERLGTTFLITSHSAKVNQVTFANWNFKSRGVGYIYSNDPKSIKNVKLDNIDIEVCPSTQAFGNGLHMPCSDSGQPNYPLSHFVPYFLQIVEAENISISDFSVRWGEADIDDIYELREPHPMFDFWKLSPTNVEKHWPAVKIENSKNISCDKVSLEPFGDDKAIELIDVADFHIVNSNIKDAEINRA